MVFGCVVLCVGDKTYLCGILFVGRRVALYTMGSVHSLPDRIDKDTFINFTGEHFTEQLW